MIDSMDACATQFIKRNKVSIAKQLITSIIFDCYFTMNKKEWLEQENQEYRLSTEKRFKQFYEKYKEYYETIDEREKNSIIVGIKNRMFQEGMILESMTFNDWIQEIEKL
jgi:heterodisulfide reductase subunit B